MSSNSIQTYVAMEGMLLIDQGHKIEIYICKSSAIDKHSKFSSFKVFDKTTTPRKKKKSMQKKKKNNIYNNLKYIIF